MEKEYILNYVTETPGNTNKAVLSGMLDSFKNSSDGDDSSSDSDGIVIFEGEETSATGSHVLNLLSSDLQNTELISNITEGAFVIYVNNTIVGGCLSYWDGGEDSPPQLTGTIYSDALYSTFSYLYTSDQVSINAPYVDDNFTVYKIIIFGND